MSLIMCTEACGQGLIGGRIWQGWTAVCVVREGWEAELSFIITFFSCVPLHAMSLVIEEYVLLQHHRLDELEICIYS
jgi:hypothetical protein